jgi:hypothetical protein
MIELRCTYIVSMLHPHTNNLVLKSLLISLVVQFSLLFCCSHIGMTQPLTEMSIRDLLGGGGGDKGGRRVGLTTLPPSCADSRNSGSVNLPELSGPTRACTGAALPSFLLFPASPHPMEIRGHFDALASPSCGGRRSPAVHRI